MGFDKWDKELHYSSEQLKRICSAKEIPNKNIIDVNTENKTCIIQGNRGTYNVSLENCECFDFRTRKLPCKHMYWLANVFGELDNLVGIDTAIGEYSLQMERSEQISLFSEEQKEIKETLKQEGITLDTLNKGDATFGCCDKYKQCSIEGKCLQSTEVGERCLYKYKLEKGEIFYSKKSPKFSQEKYDYIESWYKALSAEEREAFGEIVCTFMRLRRCAAHVLVGSIADYPNVKNSKCFKTVYDCINKCDIFNIASPEILVKFILDNETLSFSSFDYFNAKYSDSDFKTSSIRFPSYLEFTSFDYNSDVRKDENLTEEGKIKKKQRKEYQKKCWLEYLKNTNVKVLNKFTEFFAYITLSPKFSFELDEWTRDNWKLLPLKLDDFKFIFVERKIEEKNRRKSKDKAEDKRISFDFKKMKSVDWQNKF